MFRSVLSILCVLLAFPAFGASFADPERDVSQLVDLVMQRRALMPEVAAWKLQHSRPVADPEREQALLNEMAERARKLGLEPQSVVRFFELQIRWARELQQRTFDDPKTRPLKHRDLATELRPELDRIGRELLRLLYLTSSELEQRTVRMDALVQQRAPSLSPAEAKDLVEALTAIRRVPGDALARIRQSGVLRVGLTGDYAPFSVERGDDLTGADVDLAVEFARSQSLQIRFVRTSWSTLMADYQSGRFDVAAGGISITPDRAAVAMFAPTYHVGGKTAIVRCGTQAQYDTVEEINQPGVRLVVNPGGTNERFARESLGRAHVRVVSDNRAVFAEIAAGRADVMVTDDIEIELQTRQNTQLCRATPQTFTRAQKAWLMPRDAALSEAVSAWMSQAIANGKVTAALERHMQH